MNTPVHITPLPVRRLTPKPRPPVDPMVRATKRIRSRTTVGRLEALALEQAKWRRRATFAQNKLQDLQKEIQLIAQQLAHERFQHELDTHSSRQG
jgi:hypothetical protein